MNEQITPAENIPELTIDELNIVIDALYTTHPLPTQMERHALVKRLVEIKHTRVTTRDKVLDMVEPIGV
jgi:mRNA-degrading endonuclease YafQ of YafQ-DinJ toxin-antitoxin module